MGSQRTYTMDIKAYSSSQRVIISRDTWGPVLSPVIFNMSMKPFEEIGGRLGAVISFLSDSDSSISLPVTLGRLESRHHKKKKNRC